MFYSLVFTGVGWSRIILQCVDKGGIFMYFKFHLDLSAGGRVMLTFWHRNFFLILAHPVYKM